MLAGNTSGQGWARKAGIHLKPRAVLFPCEHRRFTFMTLPKKHPMQKFLFTAMTTLAVLAGSAHANNDPKAAIATLDARLSKIGTAKLEGTEKAGEKSVSGLFFGTRKINNNYDVVDEIKKTTGASATIFVKEGDDFVRVSTNVLTPEGKRGVGTSLARAKAYEALIKGDKFCAVVDVLGTAFDSCYHPIQDAGGKVIGLTYAGFKK